MADVDDPDHDDEELVESMGKLQEIQGELEKIKEEERSKAKVVKRKYNEFRKALYNRRNEIIQSISGFWVTAFLGHPALADRVSEEDTKVFKYMVSLEVEDFKDEESGYSITFNFSPNPFFEGTKLTKTYYLSEDGPTDVISTAIKWKDGKNIASGSAQENKGAKRAISEDSFFSWFGEEKKTLPIDVIDEMATTIREELWIDPLNYFSNKADEEDVDEGGSTDDDNNDHNDHNDEENNDEDFSGNGHNDADNDRDDEEFDDEDFNVSDSADDNNNDDEIEVIGDSENIEEDEIQQQYDVETDDADQDDEEEIEEQDDDEEEEIEEQDDEEEQAADDKQDDEDEEDDD